VQLGARLSSPRREPASYRTIVVVATCAASAGAHAALVPAHIRDLPALGAAFILATVALLAAGAALIARPVSIGAHRGAGLLLVALIGGYGASVTTGIPWLAAEPEPVDPVGVATKCIEAVGVVFAFRLNQTTGGLVPLTGKEARQ
jgi:hypothetical protein